ncbi:hypothetical protein C8R48DRAFT_677989 [Suillus tomentosus]|nr:hypothetical protein C8R48DRAFT_677989 [Suillus tomentosus]
MSPLTSFGSAESDIISLPRKKSQRIGRPSSAHIPNRSGPLVRQDRLQRFREKIRSQYKPRLVYHSPPYEIAFAKRHITQSSHKHFSQQDLHEGKELLQRSLSHLSNSTFRKAALVKQASAQDKRHAVIHTTWKLELIERQRAFMQSLRKEQEEELKMAETEMEFFRQLVCDRGLPALQDDQQYLEAIFAEELDDLDVSNEQYRQFMTHARKRVVPFANSSDTELSPDELVADHDSSDSHSDGGSDDLVYGANE